MQPWVKLKDLHQEVVVLKRAMVITPKLQGLKRI
jgi:hypothetical protein